VGAPMRVGEVEQPVRRAVAEASGALVEVDPAGGTVAGVGEPTLNVHPPRLAGLWVGADQQDRIVGAHPVVDVGLLHR
jgi:hypothetical protein